MKLKVKLRVICCPGILFAGCSQASPAPTIVSVITGIIPSTSLPASPPPTLVKKNATHSTPAPVIRETETLTFDNLAWTTEPTDHVKLLLPVNPSKIPGEIQFSVYPKGDLGMVKADGSDKDILLETPKNLAINNNRHALWLSDG